MKKYKKVITVPTLKKKIAQWRKKGRAIAFTNGCFDILHSGHVRYLEKAKGNQDRILILGLNNDRSIRAIKGSQRPIVPEKDRAEILAALECVDYVVLFNEATPEKLIGQLKPDVLIKGADWKGKGVAGADIVRAHGGRVEFVTYVANKSTTNIIERIIKLNKK